MAGGTSIRRSAAKDYPSLAQGHQVDERRKHGDPGKADENQRDHDMPDERCVAPKRCDHVSASDHDLGSPGADSRTAPVYEQGTVQPNNPGIKNAYQRRLPGHGSHTPRGWGVRECTFNICGKLLGERRFLFDYQRVA
jgi:hypothetical protein